MNSSSFKRENLLSTHEYFSAALLNFHTVALRQELPVTIQTFPAGSSTAAEWSKGQHGSAVRSLDCRFFSFFVRVGFVIQAFIQEVPTLPSTWLIYFLLQLVTFCRLTFNNSHRGLCRAFAGGDARSYTVVCCVAAQIMGGGTIMLAWG